MIDNTLVLMQFITGQGGVEDEQLREMLGISKLLEDLT